EVLLHAIEQPAEIGACPSAAFNLVARQTGQSNLVDRSSQRLGKAGHAGHWGEVRELRTGDGVERGAGGHRLGAGPRAWRAALTGQARRRGTGRKLGETETRQAEGGTRSACEAAREIVRRATRRA